MGLDAAPEIGRIGPVAAPPPETCWAVNPLRADTHPRPVALTIWATTRRSSCTRPPWDFPLQNTTNPGRGAPQPDEDTAGFCPAYCLNGQALSE